MAEKDVAIRIVADNSRLKGGLNSAQKMIAGFGAAIAGAGTAAFMKSVAETADRIAKLSRDMGVTTREADGLAYAFDLAGLSVQSAELTFRKFSSALTNAERGSQQLQESLAKIGLDKTALQGKTAYEALTLAANGMKKLDAVERAAIGRELFGRAGSRAVEAIIDMPDAQKFIDDLYKSFGLNDKGANSIEAMNDSFTTLLKALDLLGRSILQDLAPAITAAVGMIAKASQVTGGVIADWKDLFKLATAESERLGEGRLKTSLRGIASILAPLAMNRQDREYLRDRFGGEEQDTSRISSYDEEAAQVAIRLLDDLKTSTEKYNETIDSLNIAIDQGTISYDEYFTAVQHAHQKLVDTVPALRESRDAIAEQREEIAKLYAAGLISADMMEKANQRLTESTPEWNEAKRITEEYRTEQERLAEALEKVQDLHTKGLLSDETFSRALAQIQSEMMPIDDIIAEQEARMEAFRQMVDAAEDSMREPVSGGGSAQTGGLSEILGRAAQSGVSIEREQIEEQKKSNEYLKRIAEAQRVFAVYA